MLVLQSMSVDCRKLFIDLNKLPGRGLIKSRATILQAGFRQSYSNSSLFLKWTPKGYTFLLVYVDDMIINDNDIAGIVDVKLHLTRHLRMKDLSPLTYIPGLEFVHKKYGITVHQCTYVTNLITSARLDDAQTFDTPMELKANSVQMMALPWMIPLFSNR